MAPSFGGKKKSPRVDSNLGDFYMAAIGKPTKVKTYALFKDWHPKALN